MNILIGSRFIMPDETVTNCKNSNRIKKIHTWHSYLIKWFLKTGHMVTTRNWEKQGYRLRIDQDYDFIFMLDGNARTYPKNVANLNIPKAWRFHDHYLHFSSDLARYKMTKADIAFVTTYRMVIPSRQRGINAVYLPHGIDTDFFKPLNLKKDHDIFFSGKLSVPSRKRQLLSKLSKLFLGKSNPYSYQRRRELLLKLSKHYDCDFHTYGNARIPEWKPLEANRLPFGRCAPFPEYVRGLSTSKLSFSCSLSGNDTSFRPFESMACGSCLMTDITEGLKYWFTDRKHLVFYHDWKDLKKSGDYYLKHDDERELIGKQAREEILRKHTYTRRINRIVEEIRKIER